AVRHSRPAAAEVAARTHLAAGEVARRSRLAGGVAEAARTHLAAGEAVRRSHPAWAEARHSPPVAGVAGRSRRHWAGRPTNLRGAHRAGFARLRSLPCLPLCALLRRPST